MKESETIKEYASKLLSIVNKVRLLGSEFSDSRIVQKILVTIPERFEATISSLENAKDLSRISLAELLNALQAQEQRRIMRDEGYCFTLGSRVFSWSSKKQEIVAQSTVEAEFIAATATVNQALWLRKLLADLHMEQKESTKVFVDNQAAIAISNNPVFHEKKKHFSIKLFFLRDVQKDGAVCLKYCKTENQLADIFTKALPRSRFEFLREKLGISTY
ncbi:hypothetical protein GH714_009932 [Hevea brasiliensis]|uniref:Reverse transcriptase Ty1/copia-type domain-containing protein n=1 Tax=Hevea brasiliensis TaxID=3981 RepID=A0A6A6KDQ4_HEVBR|nr:hypothetical protein GH714_009932 [Hevea brasiliensis]